MQKLQACCCLFHLQTRFSKWSPSAHKPQDGTSCAGSSSEAGSPSRWRLWMVNRLFHLLGVWPDVRRHQVLRHFLCGDPSLLWNHSDGELLDYLHCRGNHSHWRWATEHSNLPLTLSLSLMLMRNMPGINGLWIVLMSWASSPHCKYHLNEIGVLLMSLFWQIAKWL